LYLHVFDWPTNGKLEVPGLKSKVKKAYLLADKKRVKLPVRRQSKEKIVITAPSKAPDPVNTVIVLEIENK
jgi:alpha-L-fucosidase